MYCKATKSWELLSAISLAYSLTTCQGRPKLCPSSCCGLKLAENGSDLREEEEVLGWWASSPPCWNTSFGFYFPLVSRPALSTTHTLSQLNWLIFSLDTGWVGAWVPGWRGCLCSVESKANVGIWSGLLDIGSIFPVMEEVASPWVIVESLQSRACQSKPRSISLKSWCCHGRGQHLQNLVLSLLILEPSAKLSLLWKLVWNRALGMGMDDKNRKMGAA